MNIFFNRHGCVLVGLIPVMIYFFSGHLFEINAESSVQINRLLIENISATKASALLAVKEFKARILWQCSSLLLITAYLVAVLWSCSLLRKCCANGVEINKLIVLGGVIVTLILMQVVHADPSSAMYNAIFSSTYDALRASPLIQSSFHQKVYLIINLINFLAATTPVLILVAVCSSISIEEYQGHNDLNFYIGRMELLKQGVAAGSIILVFGVIHMVAWLHWPQGLMSGNDFAKAHLEAVAATCQFWGVTFTLLLMSLYFSATALLRSRVQLALHQHPPIENHYKWMKENGFTVSIQKHAIQLGMMLMPSLTGTFNSFLDMG